MMKRSNGEGTIFKRKDGRWCGAYYDLEPIPKRHFVYASTQSEVKRKLKEKMANPIGSYKTTYTLAEWMVYYLENYKKNEIKITTYGTYFETFKKHIEKSGLGSMRLDKITTSHLQQFYNEKVKEGYNPKTVKHMNVIINSALDKAFKLGYIRTNPNILVTLPKKKAYEGKTLTAIEVMKILNEARNDDLYPIIIFAIYSGLRKGDADGKISLNQQKPSKHAGLRRFGPEKFLQRNNEFMKERPIFYKKPIKTEKDFSTWLRCFYYTTKAVITEYIYF